MSSGEKLFFAGQDGVDSKLLSDLGLIGSLSVEQASQITHIALSTLKGVHTKDGVMEILRKFSEKHGVKWGPLERLFRSMISLFHTSTQRHVSPTHLLKDLQNLGADESVASAIVDLYKSEFTDVSRSLVERTLNVRELKDLKWKFGVTSSSSEMKSVGKTFLQLQFTLQRGDVVEEKMMELSLPQFYTFLQEMEKAKAALDYFS